MEWDWGSGSIYPTQKTLLAIAASWPRRSEAGEAYCIFTCDVSRAHFFAPALKRVFVRFPPEDPRAGEEGVCGELLQSMHGTLDAAANWESACAKVMRDGRFNQGRVSPCHFRHKGGHSRCLVHGDDFVAVGTRSELRVIEALLIGKYECKVQYTGLQEAMERPVRILGRLVTYTDDGLAHEADPVHAEIFIQALGLDGARSMTTPCSGESASGETGGAVRARRLLEYEACEADGVEDTELDDERRIVYVSVTARLNYLSQDRPDMQYTRSNS